MAETIMGQPAFSSDEASRIAGVTYRQLDYWARQGLITPTLTEANGSGSKRRYSTADLVLLKVLGSINRSGHAGHDGQRSSAPAPHVVDAIVGALRCGSFSAGDVLVVRDAEAFILTRGATLVAVADTDVITTVIPLGPAIRHVQAATAIASVIGRDNAPECDLRGVIKTRA
jgi:hypothetical protein